MNAGARFHRRGGYQPPADLAITACWRQAHQGFDFIAGAAASSPRHNGRGNGEKPRPGPGRLIAAPTTATKVWREKRPYTTTVPFTRGR